MEPTFHRIKSVFGKAEWLKKFQLDFAGNIEENALDVRIVNLFCIIVVFGSVFVMFGNFVFRLRMELNIFIFIICICFSILYYLSRVKRKTTFVKPLFTALIFIFLNFTWFFNQGLEGSITFMFFLVLFIIASIHPTIKITLITSLVILNLGALIFFQLKYPSWIIAYPDHTSQFSDLSFGLLLALTVFAVFIAMFIKSYEKERRKVEDQKIEIEKQKFELENAYGEIANKNKAITDSILYAERIQNAVLPSDQIIQTLIPNYFVLNKPRDIVSGDFYFIKKIKKQTFIFIADCTGHGVPGALMSMLGVALLNEIVLIENIKNANHVLDKLREKLKISLQQDNLKNEQKEGMDAALCIIDFESLKLSFAGAHIPLFLFRKNELITYKADKMMVGISSNEEPFSEHQIQLQVNDVLYLSSDGYYSQMGGDKDKRLTTQRFLKLLACIHQKGISEQKNELETEFNKWKGCYQQTDDILIIGFRI